MEATIVTNACFAMGMLLASATISCPVSKNKEIRFSRACTFRRKCFLFKPYNLLAIWETGQQSSKNCANFTCVERCFSKQWYSNILLPLPSGPTTTNGCRFPARNQLITRSVYLSMSAVSICEAKGRDIVQYNSFKTALNGFVRSLFLSFTRLKSSLFLTSLPLICHVRFANARGKEATALKPKHSEWQQRWNLNTQN